MKYLYTMGCISFVVIAVALPTIYFANKEKNAECQKDYSDGISIDEWLKISGIADLIILLCGWIITYFSVVLETQQHIGLFIFTVLTAGSKVILMSIGITIVTHDNNSDCITNGNPLGIMAIINLILFWISPFPICFSLEKR